MTASPSQRSPIALKVPLLCILALYFGWRAVHLWWLHPAYYFVTPEDLYRGAIGQEWLRGLRFPLIDYRADDYSGGSIAIGLAASFFFRLMGSTALALKITPILLFGVALVFWCLTLARHAGKTALWVFALLYIVSPPSFILFSMTSMGFHSETIVFTALTIFLTLEILENDTCPVLYPFLLGLVAGLGLWFSYAYAVTLTTCILIVFQFRRSIRLNNVFLFVGGFLIGFWPWVQANLLGAINGLCIGDVPIWQIFNFRRLISELRHKPFFFASSLAGIFAPECWNDSRRFWVNAAYSVLGGAVMLGACISMPLKDSLTRIRERPKLLLFITVYLALYALALETCGLEELRYRIPLLPFFFAGAGLAIQEMCVARKSMRILSLAALAAFVGLGISSSAAFFSRSWAGQMASFKGYSYRYIPAAFRSRPDCLIYYHRVLPNLGKSDADDLTIQTVMQQAVNLDANEASGELKAAGKRESPLFYRLACFSYSGGILERDDFISAHAQNFITQLTLSNPTCGFLSSIGFTYVLSKETQDPKLSWREITRIPTPHSAEAQPYYDRAEGYLWARTRLSPNGDWKSFQDQLMHRLDQESLREKLGFMQGIGEYLFDRWNQSPLNSSFLPAELETLPLFWRENLFYGAGIAFGENLDEVTMNSFEKRWRRTLFLQSLGIPYQAAFIKGESEIEKTIGF